MKDKKEKQAPILVQMAIFAGILFISSIVSGLLPKQLPVPTSVIGMILLYVLLATHVIKLEWVESFSGILISMIGFLFVPSGISLAGNLDIMTQEGVKLILVIFVSTIVMLVVTTYVARAVLAGKKLLTEDGLNKLAKKAENNAYISSRKVTEN